MTEPVSGGPGAGLDFTMEIDATRDLAVDADRVEALITIHATSGGIPGPAARIAEILIMDRSLSMQAQNKIHEAQRAACAAVDALRRRTGRDRRADSDGGQEKGDEPVARGRHEDRPVAGRRQ
jgi:hypothetical protein